MFFITWWLDLGIDYLFLFSIFGFLTSYLSSEECWIINKVILHSSLQLLQVWKCKIQNLEIWSKSLIYNIVSPLSVLLLLPDPFHHLPSLSTSKGDSLVLVLVTTGLCRSALVSAGLQGCRTPGACSLPGYHRWKTPSPWHRQSSLISSLSTINSSEQRQEGWEGKNWVTFLTDLLRLQAGPTVREAEAQPWMDGGICAFKCRIDAFKCSMKRNLKHLHGCDLS